MSSLLIPRKKSVGGSRYSEAALILFKPRYVLDDIAFYFLIFILFFHFIVFHIFFPFYEVLASSYQDADFLRGMIKD